MPNIQKSEWFRATGTGVISTSFTAPEDLHVVAVHLHLSGAGSITDSFTCVATPVAGAVYATSVYTQSMSNNTDAVMPFEPTLPFERGTVFSFAFANGNSRTWGVELVYRVEVR